MKFQIISTVDGSVKSTDLQLLSRDLRPGILCQVQADGTLTQLGPITIWDLVFFTRTWAGWVNPEPTPEVSHALNLVDRWLEDGKSVTVDELEQAEAAAWAATGAAAYAAAYAAGAARAAVEAAAEDVAGAVAGAAWAAANAAGATWTAAAWAARDAACEAMFVRQHQFILETLAGR